MLYFILSWGLLTCVSFSIGLGILNLFQTKGFKRSGDRFFAAVWLGIVVLANVFLAVSIITPLSPLIAIFTAGSLVALALGFSRVRTETISILLQISERWLFIGITLAIVAAALTSKKVTWFDTGLYHFGAIQWLANYGAVPGVALLNNGFAFTSSWFALAAPFNPDFLGSRVSAVLNGYLLFLSLLHAIMGVHYILRKTAERYDWFIVIYMLLTLPLFIFTTFLSAILISPSPDMPVIMVTGIVAWAILVISDQQNHDQENQHQQRKVNPQSQVLKPTFNSQIVPLILGAGAVTFKLNGLPILGITGLFYGVYHWRNPIKLGLGAGIALLLLSPMAVFGVITSGCPLYPSSWMCMAVPWVLSSQQAAQALARINDWKSWFGSPPTQANHWLWAFGKWLQMAHFNKVMLLLAIISIVIAIWILKNAHTRQNAGESWVVLLSFLGMGFIFSQAPLIRFGLGYFVLLPTLIGSIFCTRQSLSSRLTKGLSQLAMQLPKGFVLLALFIASILFTRVNGIKLHQQLIVPPELPHAKVALKQINNIHYFSPENSDKCWGADLPCVPGELEEDVWLHNPTQGIAGGFRRQL